MKKLFTLLIILLVVACKNPTNAIDSDTSNTTSQGETDLEKVIERENLQPSPIASISIKEIDLDIQSGEVIEVNEKNVRSESFDEQGNRIEQINYNSDGSLSSQYEYKHDKKGNRVESLSYNTDGSLKSKNKYKYDEQGNQIETLFYDNYGSFRGHEKIHI